MYRHFQPHYPMRFVTGCDVAASVSGTLESHYKEYARSFPKQIYEPWLRKEMHRFPPELVAVSLDKAVRYLTLPV